MILNPTLRSLTNGILSVVCIGAFHGSTIAQQLIDIGTGVIQNNNFEYPCPYGNQQPGARHAEPSRT